jgi:hypothetical protein
MKTRLAKHTSRTVFHRLFSKADIRSYTWAINLKPGDIINGFDGWNCIVDKIEIRWQNVGYMLGHSMGTYVEDVCIRTTDGYVHYISERGCVVPAISVEKITRWYGKEIFDKMKEFGAINDVGTRVRFLTSEERTTLAEIWERNHSGM